MIMFAFENWKFPILLHQDIVDELIKQFVVESHSFPPSARRLPP